RLGKKATERKPEYEPRRARVTQERAAWAPAHSFESLRTYGRFRGLEIEENVAAIFVLGADLHSGHAHLNLFVDGVSVEPPHLRHGARLVHPYAREVRLAGRIFRRRRLQVRFTIPCARHPGLTVIQPLRMRGDR